MARKMWVHPNAITITKSSSEDMSAAAGEVAKQDAGGTVSISDAATDAIIGIVIDGGNASGDPVTICIAGLCQAKAGADLNENEVLTSESGGAVIDTTTLGNNTIGYAIDNAADGDYFKMNVVRSKYGTYA